MAVRHGHCRCAALRRSPFTLHSSIAFADDAVILVVRAGESVSDHAVPMVGRFDASFSAFSHSCGVCML